MEYPTGPDTEIEPFIAQLRQALSEMLPGAKSQLKMAPIGRQLELASPDARQSAVLALLHLKERDQVPVKDRLSLVFTLRPTSLRHHAGQISFPGGGSEPQDTSLAATALRETSEELGISTNGVTLLGELTPLYIAPSRNLVHPFVGWLPRLPRLSPDPVEVSEVLHVPLSHLLNPRHHGEHLWYRDGATLTAPCYVTPPGPGGVTETHIWGATAMMISELLDIIRPLLQQN